MRKFVHLPGFSPPTAAGWAIAVAISGALWTALAVLVQAITSNI
jgi:hypothetical protein